jgi:CheY-like chemotaxis protein
MLKLRRRHQPPQLRLISERPLSLVGSRSFVLHARPQLESEHPLRVLCGEPRVVALFHWLDALPNTERVSIACQRQAPGACQRARERPRGAAAPRRHRKPPETTDNPTREVTHMDSPLILLVEDDRATRSFLAENLSADGYQVLQAENRRHALHLLATHRPQLVLADINGQTLGLLDAVRAGDGLAGAIDPNTPMIVLAAGTDELERVRV